MEAGGLEPGEVERAEVRARGDGPLGVGVVLRRADGHHVLAVAVRGLEDRSGDVGPAPDGTRARAVVDAVGGVRPQHVEDGGGHVAREGEAA